MTGFALYSSDDSPDRLYSQGNVDALDPDRVAAMVRYADRPLDLVVDLGERQVLWSLTAERRTTTDRTGYFVAAYRGDGNLFHGFERQLRRLHETDAWSIPYTGAVRWDVGFQLWRVASDPPAQSRREFDRLVDRLRDRERTEPVEFGMRDYASALQVVRALDGAGVDCTVAVSTGGSGVPPEGVDLVLHPGADRDFEPRSLRATGIAGSRESSHGNGASVQNASAGAPGDGRPGDASGDGPSDDAAVTGRRGDAGGDRLMGRFAGAVVVVLLGFGTYSFLSADPVHPITGLGAYGGLVGAVAALFVGGRDGTDESAVSSTGDGLFRDLFGTDRSQALPVVAYGTFLGFAFPRVLWLLGTVLGGSGFLFGSVASVGGALPSVLVYVVVVYGFSLGVLLVRPTRSGAFGLSRELLVRTAVGHGVFALCLFLSTGLAGVLWFRLVPSATA